MLRKAVYLMTRPAHGRDKHEKRLRKTMKDADPLGLETKGDSGQKSFHVAICFMAWRPGAREVAIATATLPPGSPQRMLRRVNT